MTRITDRDIEQGLQRLNELAARPLQAYAKDAAGLSYSQVGNFHHSAAYGGYQLVEMWNEHGGIHNHGGFGTKRELLTRINAMIDGLGAAR